MPLETMNTQKKENRRLGFIKSVLYAGMGGCVQPSSDSPPQSPPSYRSYVASTQAVFSFQKQSGWAQRSQRK